MLRYSGSDVDCSLLALGDEATLIHYRVNVLLERIHGGEEGVAGQRGVLRNLLANGAMTVPQIAALRPVSRQYIQTVVNALAKAGLVTTMPNPAHRKSKLIAITEAGKAKLAEYAERERPLLEAAGAVADDEAQIASAVRLLRRLRQHLDALLATTAEASDRGNDNE